MGAGCLCLSNKYIGKLVNKKMYQRNSPKNTTDKSNRIWKGTSNPMGNRFKKKYWETPNWPKQKN